VLGVLSGLGARAAPRAGGAPEHYNPINFNAALFDARRSVVATMLYILRSSRSLPLVRRTWRCAALVASKRLGQQSWQRRTAARQRRPKHGITVAP
jgi:hypothetical protein